MTTETNLTLSSIAQEGIEIKVTQADVIDMLVNERLTAIDDEIEAIEKSKSFIVEMIAKEKDKIAHTHIKRIARHLLPNLIVEDIYVGFKNNTQKVLYIYNSDFNQKIKYKISHDSLCYSSKYVVELTYKFTSEFKNTTIETIQRFKSNGSVSLNKEILQKIEEHNTRVNKFFETLPKEEFTQVQLTKKLKMEFTKSIVKSGSKEFIKTLESKFNVKL
jgi:phosphoribosylformylglycinamidine (FGAM) synthase PurS component